ncbi:MAG: hypothetical protein QNJ15_11480 [Erythrobacter sp.]|nr:hypothetical protein [Erythrobacter sp.]
MEQALVLASIVLGVAIAFELEHLNGVLRAKNVKWHWAQPLFALFVLLTIIAFWWGAVNWSENASDSDEPFSLGRFLPMMFQLVLLALLAAASFPDKIGEDGLDLAQYYQENRRYQWTLMALYFWAVYVGFVSHVLQTSESVGEVVNAIAFDTIYAIALTSMIFLRRWWQVAIGFAIAAIAPAVWFTRTLG